MMSEIILPKKIEVGATAGIFTPSFPAHVLFSEKYQHGLSELNRCGFHVKEGSLTRQKIHQGYRSGTAKERAEEFMELILDDEVDFLISTIGGYNSSSMLPYLNYSLIRKKRKIITGYSDVTSLHMAILTQSGLSTFYGPAVVPTFGEWPKILPESFHSFTKMATKSNQDDYTLPFFPRWSNHFRNAFTDEWKTTERAYFNNQNYSVLSEGRVSGNIVIANLNTLSALAGTKYFPSLKDKILLLEEMNADFDQEERSLNQMLLMGVFDQLKGLIFGKPENLNSKNAPFNYDALILEILGKRNYPIITGFDCSHTHPMHTIPQMILVELKAFKGDSSLVIKGSSVMQ